MKPLPFLPTIHGTINYLLSTWTSTDMPFHRTWWCWRLLEDLQFQTLEILSVFPDKGRRKKTRFFVRPEFVIYIWETVPPPTHVWEKFPQKRRFLSAKFFLVPSLRFKWGRLFHRIHRISSNLFCKLLYKMHLINFTQNLDLVLGFDCPTHPHLGTFMLKNSGW